MAQIVLGPNRAYPSLPAVSGSVENHTLVLQSLREAIEIHERRTKNIYDSFVRLGELRDLGLLNVDESTGIVEDEDDDGSYIKRDGTSSATTGLILFGSGIDVAGNAALTTVTVGSTLSVTGPVDFDSSLVVAGALTALSYGGILEANLLDKSATETVTGDWTFNGLLVIPEQAVLDHEAAIDHDALTNFVAAEHIDWSATGAEDVHADRISEASVTQHEAAIDHDALTNFVAAEHIDWSATGAEDVHADRISEASVTQHEAALSIAGEQVDSGTVADARLSSNVPLLNGNPQTFDGRNFFTASVHATLGAPINISSTAPTLLFTETDGASDEKNWGWQVASESMRLIFTSDAAPGSAVTVPFSVDRGTGTGEAAEIDLTATLIDINGDVDISGTGIVAGNIDSGAASDGQVLTADGAGGAAWEDATGGSGSLPADPDVNALLFWDDSGGSADWADRLQFVSNRLRILDSGLTDYADFYHDSTDFNTEFTNTAEWNINTTLRLTQNIGFAITSAAPQFRVEDSDGAADAKNWLVTGQPNSFQVRAYDDAYSAFNTPLDIQRSGATISEIELNATLIDINGAVDISGTATFTGVPVISGTVAQLQFFETDAGSDEKLWSFRADGDLFRLSLRTDADGFGATAIQVARTGTTVDEIELNATLLDFNGRLDVQETIAAAGSISGIGGSGVYARLGVANALLSSGTDVFFGRSSAISGFTNGDAVIQSYAGSVKAVVAANVVGEFHATGLDLPVSGSEVEFTGSSGPLGIEFHPSSGVAAEWVDIYYRTTPDTLSIERSSDSAIFAEFFPATMTVDFPQLVTITGSSFIVDGPTRIDFIDGLLDVQAGISGSYSDNSDSGSGWGANIWSMGDAYAGSGYGTSFTLNGNHYGLVWLRPSHSATPAITDEGLYIYRAGNRIAGFGRLGSLLDQPLYLAERGSASADASSWGQFWVLNSAPNRPYFTDDAGTDLPLIGGLTQNIQNGNYTLTLADIGRYITKTSGGGGETITIPANSTTAFPSGTIIPIENRGGGNLSIAITTDTLIWPAGGGTGTRTLADDTMCCLMKVGTNVWMIAGAGVS